LSFPKVIRCRGSRRPGGASDHGQLRHPQV